jgi:hypothetical protein
MQLQPSSLIWAFVGIEGGLLLFILIVVIMISMRSAAFII